MNEKDILNCEQCPFRQPNTTGLMCQKAALFALNSLEIHNVVPRTHEDRTEAEIMAEYMQANTVVGNKAIDTARHFCAMVIRLELEAEPSTV